VFIYFEQLLGFSIPTIYYCNLILDFLTKSIINANIFIISLLKYKDLGPITDKRAPKNPCLWVKMILNKCSSFESDMPWRTLAYQEVRLWFGPLAMLGCFKSTADNFLVYIVTICFASEPIRSLTSCTLKFSMDMQ